MAVAAAARLLLEEMSSESIESKESKHTSTLDGVVAHKRGANLRWLLLLLLLRWLLLLLRLGLLLLDKLLLLELVEHLHVLGGLGWELARKIHGARARLSHRAGWAQLRRHTLWWLQSRHRHTGLG